MTLTVYPYWGFNVGVEATESEVDGKEINHLLFNLGFVRVQISAYADQSDVEVEKEESDA